jgi:hypothetical protein
MVEIDCYHHIKRGKTTKKLTDIYEDPNFDHRLDLAVAGAQLFVKDRILTKIIAENASTIN